MAKTNQQSDEFLLGQIVSNVKNLESTTGQILTKVNALEGKLTNERIDNAIIKKEVAQHSGLVGSISGIIGGGVGSAIIQYILNPK